MEKTYPSAVDWWLATILIAVPVVGLGAGLWALTISMGAGLFAILSALAAGLVIAALTWPCRYTITDRSLKIRCGLLEDEVPLSAIRKVETSHSAWSAPALSLRRLKISMPDGARLISPRDRDDFLAALKARCPQLRT